MEFASLVRRAVASPDRVGPYLRIVGRSLAKMVSRGRYAAAAGYLSGELFGTDVYLRRLAERSESGLVVRLTRYGTMVLDACDPGLSRRVLRYGVHEETSSRAYERELARLARDVDGEVGVLELGANLGYFLLLAVTVLGERAAVYAVEPHPRNAALLAENVRRNDLADRVELIEGAVGSRTGPAVLNVMPESNWHRVGRPGERLSGAVDAVDVDVVTVESLLADRGLAPSDVHVVRFDVEGYETEVIEGMGPLLDADTPLLLFVEVHPNKLSADALDRLIATLGDSGLDVVSSVGYDYVEWDGAPVDVGSFEELRDHRDAWSVELIARR